MLAGQVAACNAARVDEDVSALQRCFELVGRIAALRASMVPGQQHVWRTHVLQLQCLLRKVVPPLEASSGWASRTVLAPSKRAMDAIGSMLVLAAGSSSGAHPPKTRIHAALEFLFASGMQRRVASRVLATAGIKSAGPAAHKVDRKAAERALRVTTVRSCLLPLLTSVSMAAGRCTALHVMDNDSAWASSWLGPAADAALQKCLPVLARAPADRARIVSATLNAESGAGAGVTSVPSSGAGSSSEGHSRQADSVAASSTEGQVLGRLLMMQQQQQQQPRNDPNNAGDSVPADDGRGGAGAPSPAHVRLKLAEILLGHSSRLTASPPGAAMLDAYHTIPFESAAGLLRNAVFSAVQELAGLFQAPSNAVRLGGAVSVHGSRSPHSSAMTGRGRGLSAGVLRCLMAGLAESVAEHSGGARVQRLRELVGSSLRLVRAVTDACNSAAESGFAAEPGKAVEMEGRDQFGASSSALHAGGKASESKDQDKEAGQDRGRHSPASATAVGSDASQGSSMLHHISNSAALVVLKETILPFFGCQEGMQLLASSPVSFDEVLRNGSNRVGSADAVDAPGVQDEAAGAASQDEEDD